MDVFFMAWLVLPGWDVGWLIWGTDKSSVTLSLCWVMSCSATAVDFWVMDKVFIENKLWETLPWEEPRGICSHRRARGKTGVSPRDHHLKFHYIHSMLFTSFQWRTYFNSTEAAESTQNWKVAFLILTANNMFFCITRYHCNRDLIHCAALLPDNWPSSDLFLF